MKIKNIFFIIFMLTNSAMALPLPNKKEIACDKKIKELNSALSFSKIINPLSQTEEKEKFFKALENGKSYEPEFKYNRMSEKVYSILKQLDKICVIEKGFYKDFLYGVKEQFEIKIKLLNSKDNAEFTKYSRQLYPLPTEYEVSKAREFLDKVGWKTDVKDKNISDKDAASYLKKALEEAGLKDWKVKIRSNMGANASVSPSSRTLNIKKGALFPEKDLIRLKVHEVGVHAMRAHWGYKMPLSIFHIGLKGYLETEEGMAAYNEYKNGIDTGLRLFALRLIAVDLASKYSFSKVFNELVSKRVDKETAWQVTMRVKRGVKDTSLPGCYTRDAVYFRGYLKVKSFVENGGSFDDLLHYGKISIEDLPKLKNH